MVGVFSTVFNRKKNNNICSNCHSSSSIDANWLRETRWLLPRFRVWPSRYEIVLRPVLLFKNEWNLNQLLEDQPEFELSPVAPVVVGVEPIAF